MSMISDGITDTPEGPVDGHSNPDTDQSHMANEFRLYHTMSLKQALQLARDPVVFLQERERTLR